MYSVIALPTLGGTSANAGTINDIGWVMGDSDLPGDRNEHAALWRGNVVTDLGSLGGPDNAGFQIHNVTGGIVGQSTTLKRDPLAEGWGTLFDCQPNGGPCIDAQNSVVPFAWRNGKISALRTLGGVNGIAMSENNLGQIAGWAENATHDQTCVAPQVLDFEAVIWGPNPGETHALSPLRGDKASAALAINNLGQAVGGSGICAFPSGPSISRHAVLWTHGIAQDLGGFGGRFNNLASGINDNGQIVGLSDLPGDTTSHAFLWSKQQGLHDLGTLPGDNFSNASGINNDGLVVGTSCDAAGNCRGFFWLDGTMIDLNALLARTTSLQIVNINDLNDFGQIVGGAFDPKTGRAPAFIASPSVAVLVSLEEARARTHAIVLPERVRAMLKRHRSFLRE